MEKETKELRSENWTVQLYSDNESHMQILEYIKQNHKYAYIKHDKDINKNTGELKKEHYHVIIFLNSARTIKSLSKELNIDNVNLIEKVKSKKYMIRYLTHIDFQEKAQYNQNEIITNVEYEIQKAFKNDNENEHIAKIYEYIYTIDRYIYFHEVLDYVLKYGYYASYRRGANIINKIIEEHNKLYLEKRESEKINKRRREKEIWEYEKWHTKNNLKL